MGLALDSAGRLLVADSKNDRIQRFGLPEGETLIASARWYRGTIRSYIAARLGGWIVRADNTAVDIPPGALEEDTEITIGDPDDDEEEDRRQMIVMSGKRLGEASAPVEYGPHGLSFDKPVTITIPYDPEALKDEHQADLSIHYWNPESKGWEKLASKIDTVKKTVSAQTYHFSQYQVLAPQAQLAAADGAFLLRDVYVFPNPAVGGAKPTLHIEVGIADSVQIKIYDISGREVHSTTLSGGPRRIDDGSGTDYAYEYAWDGHIPSGVYLFALTAEKSGQAPLRQTGKFAVVR
jgi:hypothetical protein